MAPSKFYLNQAVTIAWPAVWTESVASAPAVPVTTPAVPATTVAQYNNNPFPVTVTVTGGTVTAIAVNGNATGSTSGAVVVPAFGYITLTYSAAPTWAWVQCIEQTSGAMQQVQVSSSASPDGQTGTIPTYTFQRGMVITADSSAIPAGQQGTGDQQLYQALNTAAPGCLVAWRDGTDVVGHAALSN